METLYTYRKAINDDMVFISTYSSEVEKLTTQVQESLEYWKSRPHPIKMDVLGLVEVEARGKAIEELIEKGLSISPKYLKPVTSFYSDLIKDELLRRLV